jgi:hypothetical protein
MIALMVKRKWEKRLSGGLVVIRYEGWFLFGIIPVFVKEVRT